MHPQINPITPPRKYADILVITLSGIANDSAFNLLALLNIQKAKAIAVAIHVKTSQVGSNFSMDTEFTPTPIAK
jgi:hypothetical protein